MTRKFRLITGLLAAVLAAVMLSSAVYIAVEANHNCSGEDCAICHQLQVCENLLKSIGLAGALFFFIVNIPEFLFFCHLYFPHFIFLVLLRYFYHNKPHVPQTDLLFYIPLLSHGSTSKCPYLYYKQKSGFGNLFKKNKFTDQIKNTTQPERHA